MAKNISREDAFSLLTEHTKSQSLILHCMSVEAAMVWYAEKFGEDPLLWGVTGLLHDFDYEAFPDPEAGGHPYKGVEMLREQDYPEEMCEAILGHALYTGVERKNLLSKTLFASDELSGLVYASVLVRPDKDMHKLELKSLKKKFKDKAFARGVNREDILLGVEELGIPLDEHMQNVIDAMRARADTLFPVS